MKLETITQVSKQFNVSTRTLRYYEKLSLIESVKSDTYAYRQYDQETLQRIQQILILRKLRVSLKDIKTILDQPNTKKIITIFQENIDHINLEIEAYTRIRSTLEQFINTINQNSLITIKDDLLDDTTLMESIKYLSTVHFKEGITMHKINEASQQITKLTDVRIIHIPPMIVASSHYSGENCEEKAEKQLQLWMEENQVLQKKSDIRHFGFNNPAFQPDQPPGYEIWITIPSDMEVSKPLVRKEFHGGLYAAHAITFGQFDHWELLQQWLIENELYTLDFDPSRVSPGSPTSDCALEEHLNFINNIQNPNFTTENLQLDLLVPIKEKLK